jgi:hypothetical protein
MASDAPAVVLEHSLRALLRNRQPSITDAVD